MTHTLIMHNATVQEKADAMIRHLASLAEKRLVISFAPYTPYYAVLKRIGELFPGPSKVPSTAAHKHAVTSPSTRPFLRHPFVG